jgi:hypothetical protein
VHVFSRRDFLIATAAATGAPALPAHAASPQVLRMSRAMSIPSAE